VKEANRETAATKVARRNGGRKRDEPHNGDGRNVCEKHLKIEHARGRAMIRRWHVGDRVRVRWQFTGGWLAGEVIRLDEVSVTMLWDNHTWGQFYYDSPFVWETMVKLPKLQGRSANSSQRRFWSAARTKAL
jgi:hypothetical protein